MKIYNKIAIIGAVVVCMVFLMVFKNFILSGIYSFFLNNDVHTLNLIKVRIIGGIILFAFMILCSLVGYNMAIKKGVNHKKWAILSFIFNVWALIFLSLRGKKNG